MTAKPVSMIIIIMAIITRKILTLFAAMWNLLLSSFSKARKIKWPSFLQMNGSKLLKRKSIISFALNEWKLYDICDLQNQGDIAFHDGKEFSMKCCSSSILFKNSIWHNLISSGILGVQYLLYEYHQFMIACSKFCQYTSVICVFHKVQVNRFLVVLFEKYDGPKVSRQFQFTLTAISICSRQVQFFHGNAHGIFGFAHHVNYGCRVGRTQTGMSSYRSPYISFHAFTWDRPKNELRPVWLHLGRWPDTSYFRLPDNTPYNYSSWVRIKRAWTEKKKRQQQHEQQHH